MTTRTLKADPAAVRNHNRAMLLNLLRRQGPSSRVQLQKLSGLSGAAVTGVTATLIQEGLVVETEAAASTGGRPPMLLALNYPAQAAIGVKLKAHEIDVVLTDGGANIEAQLVWPLSDHSPEAVVEATGQATRQLLREAGRRPDQLVGVGVGLPGLIDSARGVCVHSPILTWQNVPIAALMTGVLGCPVFVDNDVNALTVAERLFGEGVSADHLLVVTVGRGVGLGVVLGGQLHRGHLGGAGEIGHTVSEPGGRVCECGKRGCLEAYASEPALLARYNERAARPVSDIEDFLSRQPSDPLVAELLQDAAERLGVMLASLVNVLNPARILIGGEGVRLGPAFFGRVEATLRANAFRGLADTLGVSVRDDGEFAWARGAASLALQQTFSQPFGTPAPL